MKIEIGFDKTPQIFEVPDENVIDILKPNEISAADKGTDAVLKALQSPIGTPMLRDMVKSGQKIVIITSDITRPVPSHKIIPAVLDELTSGGIALSDITVVFALGSHRKQTEDEMIGLVGKDVFDKVRCVDGDPNDFVHLGTTKMGTPVDVTRIVSEADFRIGVGNVEYHYFAGYSGGAKAIMPGVSTRDAIQSNHSRMILPEAAAGRLEDNPVRLDIEEAMDYCSLDFIVNVVLDEHKEIIHASAGHFIDAHRSACRFLDRIYLKELKSRADIVIASQGGAPKDINLYQTQKALDNAKHAVKDGGIIILVGSCKEGLGEEVFADWMVNSKAPGEMIDRIQKDFQLGGHKAAAIALVLEKAGVYLVSDMEPDFVRSIFLEPYANVQTALDSAFESLGKDATVVIMPYGGSTLPVNRQ